MTASIAAHHDAGNGQRPADRRWRGMPGESRLVKFAPILELAVSSSFSRFVKLETI
jgi:hypothetical protein